MWVTELTDELQGRLFEFEDMMRGNGCKLREGQIGSVMDDVFVKKNLYYIILILLYVYR